MGYPTASCAAIPRSLYSPTQIKSDLLSRLPAPRSAVGRSGQASSLASCQTVNRCFISRCRSLLRLPDCRSLEHHFLRNALCTLGCCDHLQEHFSGLARSRSEICDMPATFLNWRIARGLRIAPSVQGCTLWCASGSVNLRRKNCALLPAAGRRTHLFHLIKCTQYIQFTGRPATGRTSLRIHILQ